MATVATAVPEGPTAKAAPGMVKNSTLSLRKIVYPHACCWHMDGGRTRSVLLWYACIRKGHPQPDTISHTCLSLYVGVCVRGTFNKCNKTNDFKLYILPKKQESSVTKNPERTGRTRQDLEGRPGICFFCFFCFSCLLLSPVSPGPGLAAPKAQPKAKPRRPLRKGRKK